MFQGTFARVVWRLQVRSARECWWRSARTGGTAGPAGRGDAGAARERDRGHGGESGDGGAFRRRFQRSAHAGGDGGIRRLGGDAARGAPALSVEGHRAVGASFPSATPRLTRALCARGHRHPPAERASALWATAKSAVESRSGCRIAWPPDEPTRLPDV